MARGTVRVEGLAGVKRALMSLAASMHLGSEEGQRETAHEVAEAWRREAPVDEGTHRDSIGSDDDSAFATADHSVFVEFGTSTHAAHHDGEAAAAQTAAKMPGVVAEKVRRRLP